MYGTQPLQYGGIPQYAVSSGLEGLTSYGGLAPTVPAVSAQYVSAAPQYSTGLVDVPTVPMNAFGGATAQQYQFAQQYVQQPQYELAPQQSQVVVYEQPQQYVQAPQAGALVEYNPNPAPVLSYLPTPNLPGEGGAPSFGAPGQPAPVLTQAQYTQQYQRTGAVELQRQQAMKKLAERGRVLDAFSNLQTIRNTELAKSEQLRVQREQSVYQKQYDAQQKQNQKQYAQQVKDYEKQVKAAQKAQARQK